MPINKHGSILFLAVGAIAMLSILTLGATSSVLQELRLAKMVTDNNASFYAARSAILVSRFLFSDDESPGIITLYDLRNRQVPLGDRVLDLSFVDEESRVNIHSAPADVLKRLPGLENEELLVEDIKKANITVKEDILLVENMTPEIYGQFKNLVTAYGFGGVNINTAGDQVLSIIGFDQGAIEAIKNYRNGDDGIPGTEDDKWFTSVGQITTQLEKDLSSEEKVTIGKLAAAGLLNVTSDYIAIYGKWGRTNVSSGATLGAQSFKAIVNLLTGAIVSWDEE